MSKNVYSNRRKSNMFPLTMVIVACFVFVSAISSAIDHPTSNPYETRPSPDGFLPYQIIPTPGGLRIEKDVMVTMPDGVKLACNVIRPDKSGKFPVILSMTPYGKDQTPPSYKPDGSPLPNAYTPFSPGTPHTNVPLTPSPKEPR